MWKTLKNVVMLIRRKEEMYCNKTIIVLCMYVFSQPVCVWTSNTVLPWHFSTVAHSTLILSGKISHPSSLTEQDSNSFTKGCGREDSFTC